MSNKLVSDAYFPRAQEVLLRTDANPWVRYNVFIRSKSPVCLCGMLFVENFVRMVNETLPAQDKIRLWAYPDGWGVNADVAVRQEYSNCQPVALLEGRAQDLIAVETGILGHLSLSGPATGMTCVVHAAESVPVVDMSARHYCTEMEYSKHLAYAAYVGGAKGTSSPEGWVHTLGLLDARDGYDSRGFDVFHTRRVSVGAYGRPENAMTYWNWLRRAQRELASSAERHGFQVVGTIPHALNALLGGSVASAKAFHEVYPEEPLTVLTDYEGRELDVAREAVETFGEKLAAVRLDTHGGRVHQGGQADFAAHAFWEKKYTYEGARTVTQGLMASVEQYGVPRPRYLCGPGVTVEAYMDVRELLDKLGAHHVKIVLSSGFNAEKVGEFRSWIDPERTIIGTGSWVGPMDVHPTMDIVEINAAENREGTQWRSALKAGRVYKPNPALKEVDVA